jgi:probable rRNA maturation factor
MGSLQPASADVAVRGDTGGLARWRIVQLLGPVLAESDRPVSVTVTFVAPRPMRELNAGHLAHDWVTDVLTFVLPQPDGSLVGDIYVCRFAAVQNARHHAVAVREELFRVLIHGTLHLLGWDHPNGAGRETSPMWQRQEQYLAERA